MALDIKNDTEPILSRLNTKELVFIKSDFGLIKTELTYLLTLGKRYRKNVKTLIKN